MNWEHHLGFHLIVNTLEDKLAALLFGQDTIVPQRYLFFKRLNLVISLETRSRVDSVQYGLVVPVHHRDLSGGHYWSAADTLDTNNTLFYLRCCSGLGLSTCEFASRSWRRVMLFHLIYDHPTLSIPSWLSPRRKTTLQHPPILIDPHKLQHIQPNPLTTPLPQSLQILQVRHIWYPETTRKLFLVILDLCCQLYLLRRWRSSSSALCFYRGECLVVSVENGLDFGEDFCGCVGGERIVVEGGSLEDGESLDYST